MSKKLREQMKDNKAEMDMTSMIDVVFLLLIFFMCATKFRAPEGMMRAFLPRDRGNKSTSPVVSDNCRIFLQQGSSGGTIVTADKVQIPNTRMGYSGEYEAKYLPEGVGSFDRDSLLAHLADRKANYTGLSPSLPVIVDFQADVPWKYVVEVLDVCKEVEITDIGFAMPEIPLD